MAYKVKKEWSGIRTAKFNKPFDEFTQREINNLLPGLRNQFFIKEATKKKKKDVDTEGQI